MLQSREYFTDYFEQHYLVELLEALQEYQISSFAQLKRAIVNKDLYTLGASDIGRLREIVSLVYNHHDSEQKSIVGDPIHGALTFKASIWENIIDTPIFQRLRNIKQLGSTEFVYPGSTHSRYNHSLGVGHLASKWYDLLSLSATTATPTMGFNKLTLRDCVTIGGLVHDLGHGPFSHSFETHMKRRGIPFQHEQMSVTLLQRLIQEGNIDIDTHYAQMIKDIVVGNNYAARKIKTLTSTDLVNASVADLLIDWRDSALTDEAIKLNFWEEGCKSIVANHTSGVDVDRVDYLQRDAAITRPIFANFDASRVFRNSSIVDGIIAFNQKVDSELTDFFVSRYKLFSRVYYHRANTACELMVLDIFDNLHDVYRFDEFVDDPDKFITLTDGLIHDMGRLSVLNRTKGKENVSNLHVVDNDEKLSNALELSRRMQKRDLYMCCCELQFEPNTSYPEITAEAIAYELSTNKNYEISADQIIVAKNTLTFGHSHTEPWETVLFYDNKSRPTTAMRAESLFSLPNCRKTVMPANYKTLTLRVFTKVRDSHLRVLVSQVVGTMMDRQMKQNCMTPRRPHQASSSSRRRKLVLSGLDAYLKRI